MTPWEKFSKEKLIKIFTEKKRVLDIGGGLRIAKDRGDRYDPSREWLVPYVKGVEYLIMDPVPDYHPDVIGDIHQMPFADNSQPAVVCIAVLEHVEDPWQACREIYRVLEPEGYAFIYVPFLYYYHPEIGYYHDYWRFTEDALRLLFKQFQSVEIEAVRGALETWLHLSPFGKIKLFARTARLVDRVTGKTKSRQVSGYQAFLVK